MAKQEKPMQGKQIVQQATVVFAGDEIIAVLADDGYVYGALPHLCRALGLETERQRERIEEHSALSKGLYPFPLMIRRQLSTFSCLRSDLIPYWLAVVPTQRMKPEKKARIDYYQDQVADVLSRLFGTTTPIPNEGSLVEQHPALAEGLAIARMALDQAQLAAQRSEETSEEVRALKTVYETRIAALEAKLLPRAQISEEQAEQIADLVKQAAIALNKKMGSGNYFGTLYGQLYRMFGITSYKLLTAAQYPKAVAWLEKQIKDYGN
ncbi:MAG TPA: phage antirepressor N-terminal domain-containing protein [Ktedonosporobacter sp.]|nr:phage antirepressor N-terminal domain-containing protein [Ktedonosporobacter sp.]